jgi:hypothetical protein
MATTENAVPHYTNYSTLVRVFSRTANTLVSPMNLFVTSMMPVQPQKRNGCKFNQGRTSLSWETMSTKSRSYHAHSPFGGYGAPFSILARQRWRHPSSLPGSHAPGVRHMWSSKSSDTMPLRSQLQVYWPSCPQPSPIIRSAAHQH